jgi:hypothetical protein
VNTRRTGLAVVLLALLPVAIEVPALAVLTAVTTLVWILIAVETRSYGENRARLRQEELARGAAS